jgi:hypothetical protein
MIQRKKGREEEKLHGNVFCKKGLNLKILLLFVAVKTEGNKMFEKFSGRTLF